MAQVVDPQARQASCRSGSQVAGVVHRGDPVVRHDRFFIDVLHPLAAVDEHVVLVHAAAALDNAPRHIVEDLDVRPFALELLGWDHEDAAPELGHWHFPVPPQAADVAVASPVLTV